MRSCDDPTWLLTADSHDRIERELMRLKGDPNVAQSTIDALAQVLLRQRQNEIIAQRNNAAAPQ